MLEENADVLIVENQSLDADEQKKKDILGVIESYNSFQEAVEQLEKEKLIWYLIGPLRKDEDITEQINLKWEKEFQQFEQSVKKTQDEIHSKLKGTLSDQSFLAYPTKDKDNDFNIRFENKEEPVKISDILRASGEGKVYHISLKEDSKITASKKNGNERHYDFTGSGSSKMTINWQAKDSEGNSVDCSMTIEVGSDGIQKVIDEPKFGEITDSEEVLKLVEQNKEVFINGKSLLEAFIGMGKNVINQPMQEEETFIRNLPESPQPPTPDSSGYFSLENTSIPSTDDEEELEQEENELKNKVKELESRIKELEEENVHLRKENAKLREQNKKIAEESDKREGKLIEENQALQKEIIKLKTELEKKIKELAEKNQGIRRLKQRIGELEQKLKDKDSEIADLKSQLADEKNKVQSTDKINEELQEKLKQNESELNKLRAENTRLKSDLEKIVKDLKDNYGKQLAGKEKELADVKNLLNEEQSQNKELAKELKKLQKEKEDLEEAIQQPSGKSLAVEIEEVNEKKDEEVKNLKEEIKRKDEKIQQIEEEKGGLEGEFQSLKAKYSKVENEDREYIAQLTHQLEQAKNELVNDSDELNKQIESLEKEKENLLEQLRTKSTDSASFRKQQSEIDKLKQQLEERENMITHAQEKLYSTEKMLQSISEQKETKAMGVQTDVKKDDFRDLYDKKGKYVKTELSDPSLTPAEAVEVEIRPQNIMDWSVPIPDDKPEKLIDPLKPTKVNTELSDPSLTSVEDPEKSRHKA